MDETTPTRRHLDDLYSDKWDASDSGPRRLAYAVFSPPRTGSERLCAHFRRDGLGIPLEYLNPRVMPVLGKRLGCIGSENWIEMSRYWQRLLERRTERGVFGIKIQPNQLNQFTRSNDAVARKLMAWFPRLIVLRRRDKLAQAISLARAQATDQWSVFGGESETVHELEPDDRLMRRVAECLEKVLANDIEIDSMIEGIDPARVRRLDYEALDEATLDNAAAWLWQAAGGRPAGLKVDRYVAQPTKQDRGEAAKIKARFLARIGVS